MKCIELYILKLFFAFNKSVFFLPARVFLFLSFAVYLCAGFSAHAASQRVIFDNGSNVVKYRNSIKRDIFYLPDEKFVRDFEIKKEVVKDKNDYSVRTSGPVKTPRNLSGGPEAETFRVEAIIKIGDKGCAVINSKLWYINKNNFGYMLVKLNDESVEIKTPSGDIIKSELIKKKAVESIDE